MFVYVFIEIYLYTYFMKCLVTGGAGFIGSHVVKALVERGDRVTVVDDFSVGRMEHLTSLINIDGIDVTNGSVCDIDLMRKLISNNDVVFHLAVQCLVKCNEKPLLAQEVNALGTFNVCLAAYEANKSRQSRIKVVYVSSSEVYGTARFVPMNESHPTEPQSIYGLSKLIGELYVKQFNRYYGVPAVIIRPFNAYGPNHRIDQYAAVITNFIHRLEKGQPPIIEGTGMQSRDFTYVTDTAEGIVLMSEHFDHGEVINIGSGKSTPIKTLATTMMDIYNIHKDPIFIDPRPNDVFKLEADTILARDYGYQPKVNLEDGLTKYINWWKQNGR